MAATERPAGILDRLDYWAQTQPTKTLFTYLGDDGKPIATYTFQDIAVKTAGLARQILAKAGATLLSGDRVLLVYLPSLDFIVAFLACFRAGLVPVPVYPPDPRRSRAYISAFSQIAEDCSAKAALSHADYLRAVSLAGLAETAKKLFSFGRSSKGGPGKADWPELTWINTTELLASASGSTPAGAAAAPVPTPAPGDAAFLQYTSGSTADPKGVIVTHACLQHNLTAIMAALEADQSTVVVSWLPQYHDMGLIGSLVGTLFCGGSGVLMSPLSFIKRPHMWLEAMSCYRATHVQSPNFGYKLAARKWRDHMRGLGSAAPAPGTPAALDLSSVRQMFNAAEPVTADAIADFAATFAPYGLGSHVLRPGYGLAEHTVYVCDGGTTALRLDKGHLEHDVVSVLGAAPLADIPALTALHEQTLASVAGLAPESATSSAAAPAGGLASGGSSTIVVSCGPVSPFLPTKCPDVIVLVVDRDTGMPYSAASGRVGEVWLSSPSCAGGYWGKPEVSTETFHARLRSPAGAGGLLQVQQPSGDATAMQAPGMLNGPAIGAPNSDAGAVGSIAGAGAVVGAATSAVALDSSTAAGAPVASAVTGASGASAPAGASAGASSAPAGAATAAFDEALYERFKGADFLRTGDLGFIHEGQLYICGRAKDLIIVRGRNHYPQDIEATAEADARLRPGCSAAFQASVAPLAASAAAAGVGSAGSGAGSGATGRAGGGAGAEEEGIVLVAEVRDAAMTAADLAALRDSIRSSVAREHGEGLSALLLLKPHAARKTTSGKIARKWNRRAFLAMHSDQASAWHPSAGAVLLEWRTSPLAATVGMGAGAGGADAADSIPPIAAAALGGLQSMSNGGTAAPEEVQPTVAGGLVAATSAGAGVAATPGAGGPAVGPPLLAAGAAVGAAGAASALAASSGAGAAAPAATAASTAPPPPPPAAVPTQVGVVGPELVANLQEQVAHLLRCSPEEVNPRTALIDTGLDSMAMVQLGPVLRERYGLYVADEHLFNSGFTIEWMLANQAALRAPYLGSLEPVAFAAAASQVPIPPHDAAAAPSAGGAAASGAGAAGVGAAGAGAAGVGGVLAVGGPGVAPTTALPPRRRHQPSWFERNFPCCAWCF